MTEFITRDVICCYRTDNLLSSRGTAELKILYLFFEVKSEKNLPIKIHFVDVLSDWFCQKVTNIFPLFDGISNKGG